MDHISSKQKIEDFKKYLETSPRIILSAKFGDGKTTFLKEITDESNEEFNDYQFFTIYPVNYVVSKNEDIFEYIKRDILKQLAEKNLLDDIDLNALVDSIFTFESLKEVISFLLSFVPGGAVYNKLLNRFLKVKKTYDKKKTSYEKYEIKFETQIGGLYEQDAYTKMIKTALEYMEKEHPENKKKKSVLIIEDLDRLDPDHLFRILNIISAHIDQTRYRDENDNKFGFNNIVLVMDYDTTKHIFQHFYGANANYDGYMSKFFCKKPFYYSIKEIAYEKIKNKIYKEIGFEEVLPNFQNFNDRLKELSMRDLTRISDFEYKSMLKRNVYKNIDKGFSFELPFFKLLMYMVAIGMGNEKIMKDLSSNFYNVNEKYLELMAPLYFLIYQTVSYHYQTFQDQEYFNLIFKIEYNIVMNIQIKMVTFLSNPELVTLSVLPEKDIKKVIDKLRADVTLSSLPIETQPQ